jgi:8-oxo-dGTP pyrophosphatase MutT (NUDIX family)
MKIFLDDRMITFSAVPPAVATPDEWILCYESPRQLEAAFLQFETMPHFKTLTVAEPMENPGGSSPAETAFMGLFKRIDAAGGLVVNEKGDLLFIERLGRWDLPKGKINREDYAPGENRLLTRGSVPSEAARRAAIREVKEETGLAHVAITGELSSTWHIYTRKEKRILKRTWWFSMETDSKQPLTPQLSEAITSVQWIQREKMGIVLGNTYGSLREMLREIL